MNCPKCKKSDEVVKRSDGHYCLDCGERIAHGAACSLPLADALQRLPEVTWDRFTHDDEYASAFGWIARGDGKSDFVHVMIDKDGPWLVTTSSARYSADFSARLGMDGHGKCLRVEDHFPEVRCVRLKEESAGGHPPGATE